MTKRFTMGNRPKRPYRINQMAEPAQLSATMKEHGMDIPVSEDLSPLYQPRKVGKKTYQIQSRPNLVKGLMLLEKGIQQSYRSVDIGDLQKVELVCSGLNLLGFQKTA